MIWVGCLAALSLVLLAAGRLVARKAAAMGVCHGSARVTARTGARYEVLRRIHEPLGAFEGIVESRRALLAGLRPRDGGGPPAGGPGHGEPLRSAAAAADLRWAEAQAEWDRCAAAFHRLSGGPRST